MTLGFRPVVGLLFFNKSPLKYLTLVCIYLYFKKTKSFCFVVQTEFCMSLHQGHTKQEEGTGLHHSGRTRGRRVKHEVSFSNMGTKTSSPANEDKVEGYCTR